MTTLVASHHCHSMAMDSTFQEVSMIVDRVYINKIKITVATSGDTNDLGSVRLSRVSRVSMFSTVRVRVTDLLNSEPQS